MSDELNPQSETVKSEVPVVEEAPVVKSDEPEPTVVSEVQTTVETEGEEPALKVDVSFDDAQLAKILEAGLEPVQARQEIGLELVHNRLPLTLSEAIKRALVKYPKV